MRHRRRSSPPGATSGHCATPIGSTPGFTRCWCGRAIAKPVGNGRCEASTSPSGCSNSLNRIDPSISPIVTSSSGDLPGSISISDRSSSCTTTSDCAWTRWPRSWATRPARSDRDFTGRRRRCALRSRRTPVPEHSPEGRWHDDERSPFDRRRRPPHRLVRSGCTEARARRARRGRACADCSDATAPGLAAPRKVDPHATHDAAHHGGQGRPDPRGPRAPHRPCRRAPADRGRSAGSLAAAPGRIGWPMDGWSTSSAATSSAPTTVGSTSGP